MERNKNTRRCIYIYIHGIIFVKLVPQCPKERNKEDKTNSLVSNMCFYLPHCDPCISVIAFWIGCKLSPLTLPMPSTVVTWQPSAANAGIKHALTLICFIVLVCLVSFFEILTTNYRVIKPRTSHQPPQQTKPQDVKNV